MSGGGTVAKFRSRAHLGALIVELRPEQFRVGNPGFPGHIAQASELFFGSHPPE
jgi:hypothetical protein